MKPNKIWAIIIAPLDNPKVQLLTITFLSLFNQIVLMKFDGKLHLLLCSLQLKQFTS